MALFSRKNILKHIHNENLTFIYIIPTRVNSDDDVFVLYKDKAYGGLLFRYIIDAKKEHYIDVFINREEELNIILNALVFTTITELIITQYEGVEAGIRINRDRVTSPSTIEFYDGKSAYKVKLNKLEQEELANRIFSNI